MMDGLRTEENGGLFRTMRPSEAGLLNQIVVMVLIKLVKIWTQASALPNVTHARPRLPLPH